MKLEVWLEKHAMPIEIFAERIGVHRSSVYRFIKGEAYPRRETMRRIEEVTKNQVSMKDIRDTDTRKIFQSWLVNDA
jgi:hypothetical protein